MVVYLMFGVFVVGDFLVVGFVCFDFVMLFSGCGVGFVVNSVVHRLGSVCLVFSGLFADLLFGLVLRYCLVDCCSCLVVA